MIAAQAAPTPSFVDSARHAGTTHRVVRVCMQCRDVLGYERWPGPGAGTQETTGLCAPCCRTLVASVETRAPINRCA